MIFKYLRYFDKVRIISEPVRRIDGYYLHVKVPCVIEPVTISVSDLLSRHANQLSTEDKLLVINTFKLEVKYKLLYVTDKEFLILNFKTQEESWLDLTYDSLKKLSENSMRVKDIIKVTQRIEYESMELNKSQFDNYSSYSTSQPNKVVNLKVIK